MGRRTNGEGSWSETNIKDNHYFQYKIVIDGSRKSFYGKTKKEALEKYKRFKSLPKIEEKTQDVTFFNYAHSWLFEYKKSKIKPKTFDYYDTMLNNFLKDTKLGQLTIKQLNSLSQKECRILFKNHIYSYLDKAKSTLDGLHTLLSQICKYGILYQDFAYNYMQGVDKVGEKDVETKKKEIIALDYSEVMKLWDEMLRKNEEGNVVNGKVGTYVYGIGAYALLFCCFTGLRWGEVTALRWEDIQEQNGKFYFRVDKQFITIKDRDNTSDNNYKTVISDPKSEKSNRYIPLSSKTLELIELVKERFPKCCEPDHLIFSTTNNPYSASTANRLLKAMCIRAEVPMVSPHALRHSFASILLNEDEKNLYAVSDLLGHSSSDVTYKKYIDIFEKNKIDTISLFDNIESKKGDSTN